MSKKQVHMSNKYATGTYQVMLFDGYGSKLGPVAAVPDNFQGGINTGKLEVANGKACSFVVSRMLYNSKDHKQ